MERLGLVVGYNQVVVGIPSDQKAVLPRHTAVLGTTGGGKSTTIAGLVKQAQAAGLAVVLLDVEGEYTHLHEPTDDPRMLAGLLALHGRTAVVQALSQSWAGNVVSIAAADSWCRRPVSDDNNGKIARP